ncbi:MAG TPA: UDP-3-O-(3-hydroxymyristoyl)glucosamine N-acyltransferase [Phycisphaerae bacterium]
MGATTLSELSDYLCQSGMPNEVHGNREVWLRGVNTLEGAAEGELSFLSNPRYERLLAVTRASAVIVNCKVTVPDGLTVLRCQDPYAALANCVVKIHGYRQHPHWGVSPQACVHPTARIGADANIAPGVTIAANVEIGRRVTLYPGCYVADGCRLGDDVVCYPNVTIYDGCVLGNRVTIHAGTVIGEDGLGYAPVNDHWVKIPQIGIVRIDDDVEIGANCTIDRATVGYTQIGRGTKFSNLVAIGHGTRIGEDCLLVAQVGIAGSTQIGRHVTLAGQAGVVGHVQIGDHARVGAKAGVTQNIEPGVEVLGAPAVPIAEARRHLILIQKLPELRDRLRQLEEEVRHLKQQLEQKSAS